MAILMSERTLGQKVGQWLQNLTVMIPLLSTLGFGAIYGNSDTVKKWVHGSPLTVEEVTPDVNPVNYDRIIKELIELNKKQDGRMKALNKNIDGLRQDIRNWHE
jgi:hypothetical protein